MCKVFGEFSKFHVHEFRAYHWGVEVEILQIYGAVACTLCGDNAVEVSLDFDHVDGGGTAIPRIGDAIATNGEASAIGIGTIVDAHAPVCVIFGSDDCDVSSPMKTIVLVPLLTPGMPWARQPSLIV